MTNTARRIVKCFARVGSRLVHYRKAGSGPAVVLLHDSPRSSRLHLDTMAALMDQFTVYALDTPGYGNSDPLPAAEPTISELGVALGETLAVLSLANAAIYATHTSSKIALDYVAHCETPPPLLILDGLAIPRSAGDEAFIAEYMRPFHIDAGGAYLAAEWTRIRDGFRWFPWFNTCPECRLPTPIPSPTALADFTLDLFSTGPFYPHAYAGAMRYDPRPALRAVRSPVIVAAKSDDVLFGALDLLPADRSATITVERLSADRDEWLTWLRDTLARFALTAAHSDQNRETATEGPAYADLAHGQMFIRRAGPSVTGQRPLLILEAPTTLHAGIWQDSLSATRATIVPELPGYGESNPFIGGSLDDYADAVAAMLDAVEVAQADVLAIGFAVPLGVALARRHPSKVGILVLDAPAQGASTTEQSFELICPDFPFDMAGAHLHRIWHMLRDGEAHWPWFDQSVEAIRAVQAATPENLHHALVGILKQPKHYGDIVRAGLIAGGIDMVGIDAPVLLFDLQGDPAYQGVNAMADELQHGRMINRPVDIATAAMVLSETLGTPITVANQSNSEEINCAG